MQKNEGSPLRKSVNCAGKWTASDISQKKGRSNNNEQKAIERQQSVIPGLKSQMFRIQLHKRGHSVQKKGYLIHTAFSQRGQS